MNERHPDRPVAPAETGASRPAARKAYEPPRIVFREPIETLVAGCTGTGSKTPISAPLCSFGGS